jgi:hypothetical protein
VEPPIPRDMEPNFHTPVEPSQAPRILDATRPEPEPPVADDRPAVEASPKPTAREIADAICRFVATGARG